MAMTVPEIGGFFGNGLFPGIPMRIGCDRPRSFLFPDQV
jgi:hypothetical protein